MKGTILTFSFCYSSCRERANGSGTACGTGTGRSRRMRRRKRRTCLGTCHMTRSWSGKTSCENISSGTWREKEKTQHLCPAPRGSGDAKELLSAKTPSTAHGQDISVSSG